MKIDRTMTWQISRYRHPDLIRVSTYGDFSARDTARMYDDLFSFTEWEPRLPILFDNRELDTSNTTTGDWLLAASNLLMRNRDFALTRVAILVSSMEAFRTTGRFEDIMKYRSYAFTKIFLDENEALEW